MTTVERLVLASWPVSGHFGTLVWRLWRRIMEEMPSCFS